MSGRADAARGRPVLVGRDAELTRLIGVARACAAGRGGALVVRGEPGAGVTSLLLAAADAAPGSVHVVRMSGLRDECEVEGAGVVRLAAHLGQTTVDGTGPVLHEFLRSLGPTLIVVDNAQWLDRTSLAALAFCGNRLSTLPVALLIGVTAVEQRAGVVPGIDEVALPPLDLAAAEELVRAASGGRPVARVVSALRQAVNGNPTALIGAARCLDADQLAGRSPLPDPVRMGERLEATYVAQLLQLPAQTRQILAAVVRGVDRREQLAPLLPDPDAVDDALAPAEERRYVEWYGGRLRFRHALIRSAAWFALAADERRRLATEVGRLAAERQPRANLRIRLLGGFGVFAGDEPCPLPHGVVAQAVKVVAWFGSVPTEELVEMLWPGAGPGVGRSRLRNVVSRAQPIVVRDGQEVRLAPGVRVDAVDFQEQADKALVAAGAGEADARAAVTAALALYAGELLPSDRFQDWTTTPRERMARRRLQLLDALAECSAADGDVAVATETLHTAIELDPLDELRYIRGAELLAERGHASAAIGLLSRGAAALRAVGLPPSPAAAQLEAELRKRNVQQIATQRSAEPDWDVAGTQPVRR
jgi:DNA-binding SARP family transcriptional activator